MGGLRGMFALFFDGAYDPVEFSLDLETYLFEHYDEMMREDPVLTEELNDNFPDICASFERGADPTPFIKAIKKEYERILNTK